MNEFHWSARGESAESWLDHPKRSREKQPYPPVKIIFPTKATVQESAAGEKVRLSIQIYLLPMLIHPSREEELYSAVESNGQEKISQEHIFMTLEVKQALS
jgi:hypothetical protein